MTAFRMVSETERNLISGKDFVHGGGIRFERMFPDVENTAAERFFTEGDFDYVIFLHFVRRFGAFSVDCDMVGIAGVVGNGTPFDNTGYL